jgi:hypothetical protein
LYRFVALWRCHAILEVITLLRVDNLIKNTPMGIEQSLMKNWPTNCVLCGYFVFGFTNTEG